jgi:ribonuclease-3
LVNRLESRISYSFSDRALLKQALTHRSAGKSNNERLEFLGDAVLGLTISALLYRRFPDASEGDLSRLRAALVQQSTLAELARSLGLGEHLVLGAGELKSGGANRDSILADALEALLSALYIDGGLATCEERVASWFAPLLAQQTPSAPVKDAKTRLQEYLQAHKQPLPVYTIVEVEGMDHEQEFRVHCSVSLLQQPLTGSGTSRKEAEQQAAAAALCKLVADRG